MTAPANSRSRISLSVLTSLALGVTTEVANAHAPPEANEIRWLGERAIVRTNRGFILQNAALTGFRLLCNDAIQASLTEVPPSQLTSDGRLLVATFQASTLLSSTDLCGFQSVDGPLTGMSVLDLTSDARHRFYAVAVPVDDTAPGLFTSEDDGRHFEWQSDMPGVPKSVLVAPSDTSRLYVATFKSEGNAVTAQLQRSRDAGRSFTESPIELAASELWASLLAVDPNNADRVFVRVESRDGVTPERVLASNDAGATFSTVLQALGPFSLAWGADGTLWAGAADGLYRFEQSEQMFVAAAIPDLTRITCLASRGENLYACAYHENEFGVVSTSDQWRSVDWFLRFPQVTARLECSEATSEGTSCTTPFADWSKEQGLATQPATGSGPSGGAGDAFSLGGRANATSLGGMSGANAGAQADAHPRNATCEVRPAELGGSCARRSVMSSIPFGLLILGRQYRRLRTRQAGRTPKRHQISSGARR